MRLNRRRCATPAVLLLAALGVVATLASPAGAQPTGPEPGTFVVSSFQDGQVDLIDADGTDRGAIATGLRAPRGVVVLSDGTVLVAEYGGERIVGIGGRLGAELTEVVALPSPEGLAVAPDGTVWATSVLGNQVGIVDVDARTFTPRPAEVQGPGGIAATADTVYVTQTVAGSVVALGPGGGVRVVVDGLGQPNGVAVLPGGDLLVTDFRNNEVVRVAGDGSTSTFAEVDQPLGIAVDPFPPVDGQPLSVAVASAVDGVVRFDGEGRRIGTTELAVAVGVAAVPSPAAIPAAPGASPSTTAPSDPATTATTAVADEPLTSPSTRVRRSSTTEVAPIAAEESGGTPPLVTGLLVLVAAGIGFGAAYLLLRSPRNSAQAGFEVRSLDVQTIAAAFGPCAGEEVELAEAEGGLKAVEAQRQAADAREHEATQAVEFQRGLVDDASKARLAATEARRAAVRSGRLEDPTPRVLDVDDLGLTSDDGRAAFERFQRGELDAGELERRWLELDEQRAVASVRAEGERLARANPEGPWPEELLAIEEERDAQGALLRAERDLAEARADLARLAEREVQARERIADARRRLDDCQRRNGVTGSGVDASPAPAAADDAPPSLFATAIASVAPPPPPPPGDPVSDTDADAPGPVGTTRGESEDEEAATGAAAEVPPPAATMADEAEASPGPPDGPAVGPDLADRADPDPPAADRDQPDPPAEPGPAAVTEAAGEPEADADSPTAPAGSPTAPAGSPTAPAGSPTAPAGSPTAPAGSPTAPAGSPTAPAAGDPASEPAPPGPAADAPADPDPPAAEPPAAEPPAAEPPAAQPRLDHLPPPPRRREADDLSDKLFGE